MQSEGTNRGKPPSQALRVLAERLRRIERGRQPPARMRIPTGIDALDRLLPGGALRRGTLVEWLSAGPGSGAGTLALAAARRACRETGALVVIDAEDEFYPPAAEAQGIDLNSTIVVRPAGAAEALWATDQSLRCPGVGALLGWMDRLNDRDFRRLGLAVEAGGGIGLLVRPASVRREPSWAEVRLLVEPLASSEGRRMRVELLRCRGGRCGGAVELEIDDETGIVYLASKLAAPAPLQRSSGA